MLRIDINMLFTVINVLILVVAVRLLLWKPIHKILEQRQAEADAALTEAEQVKSDAEALAAQQREQLSAIDAQRAAALDEARAQASEESERILSSARAQAKEILAKADEAAERRRDETLREAHAQISEIILTATAKVSGVEGGDSALYDEFLQKAGKADE